MLDDQTFETVISSTPLISIDGRVYKNETVNSVMMRMASNELNISLKLTPIFIGIFELFYDDSVYQNALTHYVNLAYEIEIEETLNLPSEQYNEY